MAITNLVLSSHSIGNELPLFGANYFEKIPCYVQVARVSRRIGNHPVH